MGITIRENCSVDVIIPVYKPDVKLRKIISRLEKQSIVPEKIILINTEREYFDAYFGKDCFLEQFDNLIIRHIRKEEFDHGGTRRMAVELSDADYFVCMTDDAIPVDDRLLEQLLKPLLEKKASVSYARQLPGKDSDFTERYARHFNYSSVSRIKSAADLEWMGIKAFFCSNACAAYDRSVYDELGGFEKHMIFNEDMVYAGRAMDAGKRIAYAAQAKVLHTHHYTAMQQLHRNFDLGVSQAQFPELFERVSSASEGLRMVRGMIITLLRRGGVAKIPSVVINSAFKFAGYQLGKRYRRLPAWLIEKLTMNHIYWNQ